MAHETPPRTDDLSLDLTGLNQKDVEAVRSIVDTIRRQESAGHAMSLQEWRRLFDAYMQEVASRADRYPTGFVADDSRDAIYEGRGE
jgi:hypothetical protein